MSVQQQLRCDRCEAPLTHPRGIITVNYHHPRTLDICRDCEGEFTLWLGKHPLWNTSLDNILAGLATGDGYPTAEQIEKFKEAR